MSQVSKDVISQLAPTGVLRAGINLSNFLLVTGKSPTGDPVGVSPDMAAEIAQRLGVPVKYAPFKTPGELADAADTGAWDIGLIGAEPQRAEKIAFTAAYCEIEATYMVPGGLAAEDHRGCRQAGHQDRRDGTGRLRPLARPQHQGRHAGAHGHASTAPTRSSSPTSSMRSRDCGRGSSPTSRSCPAPASSTGSSRPCSRRSARRARTRPARPGCAPSPRRRRPRAWSRG